jgi:preprotein translocase subunit SecD
MVLRRRMLIASIKGTLSSESPPLICAQLDDPAESVSQVFTERGRTVLMLLPHGPVFSPTVRAIRSASALEENGTPTLVFEIADPRAFASFTQRHLGKDLGIFLDGKLIEYPTITAPLSTSVELVSADMSMSNARLWAALFGSDQLPTNVKLLSHQY